MFIIAGMPGGRHLSVLSDDESPAMRAFEIASHFATYSGVSFGALGARPREPSDSGAVRAGGGSGCPGAGGPPARGPGGGSPGRPPTGGANALTGRYTPEKSGSAPALCAITTDASPPSTAAAATPATAARAIVCVFIGRLLPDPPDLPALHLLSRWEGRWEGP